MFHSAFNIISAGDYSLNISGIDDITVNDGPVSASEGVELDNMSADVEFDVRDDADDIASAISYSTDALDEANSVQVQNVSGVSVTVQEAEAIQGISGYDDSGSSFIISDNATAVLSASPSLFDNGNIHVDVVGNVGASQGAGLGRLDNLDGTSGDIDFDVVDTAENIAAEIVGAGKSGDELDNAEVVIVSGGDVDVIEASAIQNIHKYAEYSSHYDITDDADNILALSSGSPVLQVSGDVTALNVDSKENALALKNNYDEDNFTLDTSAILSQLSADNASVDEALALLQSSSGASNGLTDESVISITDTVGNLDSNFHDLKTGGSLHGKCKGYIG